MSSRNFHLSSTGFKSAHHYAWLFIQILGIELRPSYLCKKEVSIKLCFNFFQLFNQGSLCFFPGMLEMAIFYYITLCNILHYSYEMSSLIYLFIVIVGIELRALNLLGKCLSCDLYPQPMRYSFKSEKSKKKWRCYSVAVQKSPAFLTLRSRESIKDSSLSDVKFRKIMKRNLRNWNKPESQEK